MHSRASIRAGDAQHPRRPRDDATEKCSRVQRLAGLAPALQRFFLGLELEPLWAPRRTALILAPFGGELLHQPEPRALRGAAGDAVLVAPHSSAALLHFILALIAPTYYSAPG